MTDLKVRLAACAKCRRIIALFGEESLPGRCGAQGQGYSTRGVIGPYTTYCDGELVEVSAPLRRRGSPKASEK